MWPNFDYNGRHGAFHGVVSFTYTLIRKHENELWLVCTYVDIFNILNPVLSRCCKIHLVFLLLLPASVSLLGEFTHGHEEARSMSLALQII